MHLVLFCEGWPTADETMQILNQSHLHAVHTVTGRPKLAEQHRPDVVRDADVLIRGRPTLAPTWDEVS